MGERQFDEEYMRQFHQQLELTKAQIGKESPPRVSFPVDKFAIRMWAVNTRWPEPPDRLYWDEEYAKKTRWGGIVAPNEFNPFAYHVDETRMRGSSDRGALQTGPGTRGMNGGSEAEYFAPIRPGDVITSVSKMVHVYERPTGLGPTFFTVTETTWTNQRGEMVKKTRGTGIRY